MDPQNLRLVFKHPATCNVHGVPGPEMLHLNLLLSAFAILIVCLLGAR